MRKTPIKHNVSSYTRNGHRIRSYVRGLGVNPTKPKKETPAYLSRKYDQYNETAIDLVDGIINEFNPKKDLSTFGWGRLPDAAYNYVYNGLMDDKKVDTKKWEDELANTLRSHRIASKHTAYPYAEKLMEEKLDAESRKLINEWSDSHPKEVRDWNYVGGRLRKTYLGFAGRESEYKEMA